MDEPWKLPDRWEWAALGDICAIQAGGTPSRKKAEYWGGGVPWVKIGDIPPDGSVTRTEETISQLGLDNSPAKILPKGTLLFSIFATIGKVGVLGIDAATNQAICGLKPKDGLDGQYLYHYLRYKGSSLGGETHGITQANINSTILKEMLVPIAPLPAQRRIVAKIESLSEKSRFANGALNRVKNLMSLFRGSVFARYLQGEPRRLADLAHLVNGKAIGSGETEVRVFKTRHVYPTGLRTDRASFLKPEQLGKIPKDRYLMSGDTLIVNTWQNLGRVCYVDRAEKNCTVDTQITIVRPKNGNVGKWIFYFLLSKPGQQKLLACERGALTAGPSRKLTHIYPKDIGTIEIPAPRPEIQRNLVERIDVAMAQALAVETAAGTARQRLDRLDQAVLAKAFRGELVEEDPTEEPARVWLESIRSRRKATVTSPAPKAKEWTAVSG